MRIFKFLNSAQREALFASSLSALTGAAISILVEAHSKPLIVASGLDDRFHEIGIDETGSMELEGSWWIPRLRLAERGAVSWQDGVKRSRWR
jgi:hypothetical protein